MSHTKNNPLGAEEGSCLWCCKMPDECECNKEFWDVLNNCANPPVYAYLVGEDVYHWDSERMTFVKQEK